MASTLSERDRAILDFEGTWAKHVGAKEEAIRQQLGLSPARYYQLLNRVIDDAAALEYDTMLVKRLQRLRAQRHDQNVTRTSGARF